MRLLTAGCTCYRLDSNYCVETRLKRGKTDVLQSIPYIWCVRFLQRSILLFSLVVTDAKTWKTQLLFNSFSDFSLMFTGCSEGSASLSPFTFDVEWRLNGRRLDARGHPCLHYTKICMWAICLMFKVKVRNPVQDVSVWLRSGLYLCCASHLLVVVCLLYERCFKC